MTKTTATTDLVTTATAATRMDRIAKHNGAVLCSAKNCPEPATQTMWSTTGSTFRACLNHTAPTFWSIYATAEHGTVYADNRRHA
jgi:hypothetical protein